MRWVRINQSLVMSDSRQSSGCDYRIRDFDNSFVLIAESRDGKTVRRETVSDLNSGMKLAEEWEATLS